MEQAKGISKEELVNKYELEKNARNTALAKKRLSQSKLMDYISLNVKNSLYHRSKAKLWLIDKEQRTYISETTFDYWVKYSTNNRLDNQLAKHSLYIKEVLFSKLRTLKRVLHDERNVRSKDPQKLKLRFHYSRYADKASP